MEKKYHRKSSVSACDLIFVLALSISFTLICVSFGNVRFEAAADEGYYLRYASYIGEHGIGGFADLFKNYLRDQTDWLYPNPLRAGFIILSSAWLKASGYSFLNLASFSLFSFCVFLVISFYFARKYFYEKIASLFTLLLAFSPLNMAMARRALLDSTFNLFCALSIWLFFDLLKKNSRIKHILFILIYSFTILVKETGVLLSLFFALYLIFHKNKKYLLSVTLFPFLIVGSVYIFLAGGASNVVDTIKIILSSPAHNEYAILFCSGPWFRYIIDYIALSPWVVILSFGFIFWHLSAKDPDETVSYFLLAAVILFFSFNFFTKNVRYVIMLDAPMRLFSVVMLKKIFETRFPGYAFTLTAISVVAISVFDYLNFYNLFVSGGIYDPVSYWLLMAKHIIPWR